MLMLAKKKKPEFKIPNFGAKNRKRLKPRWRAQRGIDNKMRIGKKFHGKSPNIGYKNSAEARFRNKKGLLEVLVHSKQELLAQKGKQDVAVRLYHALSQRKKQELAELAAKEGIKLA